MKLMGNLQAMVHATTSDEVLKNLFGLYAFEHFEIASYKSLIAMAEECGETEVVQTCRDILRQEEMTAQKLEQLLVPVTKTYLRLEAAGETSSR